MLKRVEVIALLFAVLPGTSVAETITWEASALVGPGRQFLARGVKTYSPERDIVVEERSPARDGSPSWMKSLVLDDQFAIGAAITRDPKIDGFGLVVYRRGDDNGFSWDWFDREPDGTFGKRQLSGRVAVTTKKGNGYEEIDSIEFLDDVTLRYLDDMKKPPGTHTHEVVVRKGSVLKVGK